MTPNYYKKITYYNIIKEHGEELTPVEKVINYRFYYAPIWDIKRKQFLHPQGKIFRLCKEQRDTITFDSLKELVIFRMDSINRNFEMLRGKIVNNKTYRELSEENHISQTTVESGIRKIALYIFNESTVDFDNIKEQLLSDDSINEIYIKINTNFEVDENDTSIGRNLNLSTRAYNCLTHRLQIADLKELEGMKYSELLKCRQLGRTVLKEIQSICEKYDINLVNDVFEDEDFGKKDIEKKDIIIKRLEDQIKDLQEENNKLNITIEALKREVGYPVSNF